MASKNSAEQKRGMITIQTKYNAIRQVKAGKSMSQVADDLGLPKCYISRWMKRHGELEKWASKKNAAAQQSKRIRIQTSQNEQLDEAVFVWFNQHKLRGISTTGPMIQMQALKFHKNMGGDGNFKASNGWLNRWKARYGISLLAIAEEKLPANDASLNQFRERFSQRIADGQLTRDQVFNCDETGLNYQMIPSNALAASERNAREFVENREQVTVLACSNASGSMKIPLMVIGKSALEYVNLTELPVFYRNHESALMDSQLFKEWFQIEFVPRVTKFCEEKGLPRKALLIVDKASSHPCAEDLRNGDITVEFFPPEVASLIQPMDQGVLEILKRRYREQLMHSLIKSINDGRNMVSYFETMTMKEVICWIAKAWDGVASVTIHKSWEKAWPKVSFSKFKQGEADEETGGVSTSSFYRHDICQSIKKKNVKGWINADDAAKPVLTNTETRALNEGEESHHERFSKQSTAKMAKDAMDCALAYFENLPGYSPEDLAVLNRARNIAALNSETTD